MEVYHSDWVISIEYDSSTNTVYSGGYDRQVIIWTHENNIWVANKKLFANEKTPVHALKLASQQKTLLATGDNNTVILYNLVDGTKKTVTLTATLLYLEVSASIFKDQTVFIASQKDGFVSVYSFDDEKEKLKFGGDEGKLAIFSSDNQIFTGSHKSLSKWADGKIVKSIASTHKGQIVNIIGDSTRSCIITVGQDGQLILWDGDLNKLNAINLKDKIWSITQSGSNLIVGRGLEIVVLDKDLKETIVYKVYSEAMSLVSIDEDLFAAGCQSTNVVFKSIKYPSIANLAKIPKVKPSKYTNKYIY